jgi:ABC-type branched-subunit amino acid transport system ATPase component
MLIVAQALACRPKVLMLDESGSPGGRVTYSGLAARLAASLDILHRAYPGTGLL